MRLSVVCIILGCRSFLSRLRSPLRPKTNTSQVTGLHQHHHMVQYLPIIVTANAAIRSHWLITGCLLMFLSFLSFLAQATGNSRHPPAGRGRAAVKGPRAKGKGAGEEESDEESVEGVVFVFSSGAVLFCTGYHNWQLPV